MTWTCEKCHQTFAAGPLAHNCVDNPPVDHTPQSGPGTSLKLLLSRLGYSESTGCGCKQIAAEMDRLGVEGVRREFNRFYNHLVWQAKKKGVPMARPLASVVLKAAIAHAARGLDSAPPEPS